MRIILSFFLLSSVGLVAGPFRRANPPSQPAPVPHKSASYSSYPGTVAYPVGPYRLQQPNPNPPAWLLNYKGPGQPLWVYDPSWGWYPKIIGYRSAD